MKRPFKIYSRWCLAPPPVIPAPERDEDRERWEGEGGNPGRPRITMKFTGTDAHEHARRPARRHAP